MQYIVNHKSETGQKILADYEIRGGNSSRAHYLMEADLYGEDTSTRAAYDVVRYVSMADETFSVFPERIQLILKKIQANSTAYGGIVPAKEYRTEFNVVLKSILLNEMQQKIDKSSFRIWIHTVLEQDSKKRTHFYKSTNNQEDVFKLLLRGLANTNIRTSPKHAKNRMWAKQIIAYAPIAFLKNNGKFLLEIADKDDTLSHLTIHDKIAAFHNQTSPPWTNDVVKAGDVKVRYLDLLLLFESVVHDDAECNADFMPSRFQTAQLKILTANLEMPNNWVDWMDLIDEKTLFINILRNEQVIADQNERANLICEKYKSLAVGGTPTITLMDGHGRFCWILVNKLKKYGARLKLVIIDINDGVNKWHKLFFPINNDFSSRSSRWGDVLEFEPNRHDILYMNFCGLGALNLTLTKRILELYRKRSLNRVIFSFSTRSSPYNSNLIDWLLWIGGKESKLTSRGNFHTVSLLNCAINDQQKRTMWTKIEMSVKHNLIDFISAFDVWAKDRRGPWCLLIARNSRRVREKASAPPSRAAAKSRTGHKRIKIIKH